ncbi:4-hydroxybenzoate decarboxylase subunit C [compost metagenome]
MPEGLKEIRGYENVRFIMPGIVAMQGSAFRDYASGNKEMGDLSKAIAARGELPSCPLIVLCDDSEFLSASLSNFLWVTFTRSNPSHDIYGVNSYYDNKHWACDNVIIDARSKPHQAPPLIPDPVVEKNIERLFVKGASLGGIKLE